jgi:hypothetical protein
MLAGIASAALAAWWWRRRGTSHAPHVTERGEVIFSNAPVTSEVD